MTAPSNVRVHSVPNYTPEEVERILTAALTMLEALEVDDDLKPHVFVQACNLLAAKQLFNEVPQQVPLSPAMLGRIKGH